MSFCDGLLPPSLRCTQPILKFFLLAQDLRLAVEIGIDSANNQPSWLVYPWP